MCRRKQAVDTRGPDAGLQWTLESPISPNSDPEGRGGVHFGREVC